MFEKGELCIKKGGPKNVTFVKYVNLEICEFCEKWDFVNVNFVEK